MVAFVVVVGGLMSSSLPRSTTMIVLVRVSATEEAAAGVDPRATCLLLSAKAASVDADADSFAFSTAGGFGDSGPLLDATGKGAATQGRLFTGITSGSVTVAKSAVAFPSSSPAIALICTSVVHVGVSCVPVLLERTGSVLERTESSGDVVSAVCVAVTNIVVAAVAAPTADVEDTAVEYSAHPLPSRFSEESADSVFCNRSDIQIRY